MLSNSKLFNYMKNQLVVLFKNKETKSNSLNLKKSIRKTIILYILYSRKFCYNVGKFLKSECGC